MRAVLIVFQVCGIFAIALKSEEDVIVCSSGIKYDLTPGNNKFQCATSLFESLELICGGSGKFSRFKGIVSIFQEEHKTMKEFKNDLFCRCCLNQCTMDDIKSFCMSD
uniref:Insulin-like domain-containing protein n=1 Tax=Magallana gigas TaxID=29159 RepID=A0A8W8JCH2_MAGGI